MNYGVSVSDNPVLEVDFYNGETRRGIQGAHVAGRQVGTPRWPEGDASN